MVEPKTTGTAVIARRLFCKCCGWPIVDACCNDEFSEYMDAGDWDWWYYCSNKGCKNHKGEGIFQDTPAWVRTI